jgi:hypothetical protein
VQAVPVGVEEQVGELARFRASLGGEVELEPARRAEPRAGAPARAGRAVVPRGAAGRSGRCGTIASPSRRTSSSGPGRDVRSRRPRCTTARCDTCGRSTRLRSGSRCSSCSPARRSACSVRRGTRDRRGTRRRCHSSPRPGSSIVRRIPRV